MIADHIRACSFLIVDGVLPSNEGRGYVLRRIIRRALRHGWMLGVRGDFFWKMVAPLVEEMGEAYPELAQKRATVEQALRAEEQRFGETLEQGMKVFEEIAKKASGKRIRRRRRVPPLRHLRISGRSHRRHRARARPGGRHGRFRDRDGRAARPRACREPVREQGQLARRARERARADEVSRLRHARRGKREPARDRARRHAR